MKSPMFRTRSDPLSGISPVKVKYYHLYPDLPSLPSWLSLPTPSDSLIITLQSFWVEKHWWFNYPHLFQSIQFQKFKMRGIKWLKCTWFQRQWRWKLWKISRAEISSKCSGVFRWEFNVIKCFFGKEIELKCMNVSGTHFQLNFTNN